MLIYVNQMREVKTASFYGMQCLGFALLCVIASYSGSVAMSTAKATTRANARYAGEEAPTLQPLEDYESDNASAYGPDYESYESSTSSYDYESDNASTYGPDYESYESNTSSYHIGYESSHTAHFARLLEEECDDKIHCPNITDWCLEEYEICNGYDDCGDGSDEPPKRNVNNSNSNVTFCRWSSGFICVLPDEWNVPGEEKYDCNKNWECHDDEFFCRDGSRCIPVTEFCDGYEDCLDGSDEPPLRNVSNDEEHFRLCRGKGHRSWTCVLPNDLIQDKEKLCRKEWGCGDWLTCADGSRCIQERDYCDDILDCADQSDEPPLCKVNFKKPERSAHLTEPSRSESDSDESNVDDFEMESINRRSA